MNKNEYKITFTASEENKEIKVKFDPHLKTATQKEIQQHINTLFTGLDVGLQLLFADIPVLRPASDEEHDMKIYIFKNSEEDTKLYNARKELHSQLASTFDRVLKELFPDVHFIQSTTEYQQQLVMEMTPEEAEEHKQKVQALVKQLTKKEA